MSRKKHNCADSAINYTLNIVDVPQCGGIACSKLATVTCSTVVGHEEVEALFIICVR